MTDSGGDLPDQWLNEALALGELEKVKPDEAAAMEKLKEASNHVQSARQLAGSDTPLAMSACHDAIRKAITAYMGANGVRPRSGNGAHKIVLDYARNVLGNSLRPDDLAEADEIRRDRGLAEYGDFAGARFDKTRVEEAADIAQRIVSAMVKAVRSSKSIKPR